MVSLASKLLMILAPRLGQNVLNIDHCTLFTLIPARAHCCKLFSDEYLVDRFQSKKISNVTPFFTQNATYSEKFWQERFSHITKRIYPYGSCKVLPPFETRPLKKVYLYIFLQVREKDINFSAHPHIFNEW